MAELLNRQFFTEELPKLAAAFAQEEGGDKACMDILLRDSISLRVEGEPVCTDGYVLINHKSGAHKHRIVLPYGSIVGVSFSPSGDKPGMGFK